MNDGREKPNRKDPQLFSIEWANGKAHVFMNRHEARAFFNDPDNASKTFPFPFPERGRQCIAWGFREELAMRSIMEYIECEARYVPASSIDPNNNDVIWSEDVCQFLSTFAPMVGVIQGKEAP